MFDTTIIFGDILDLYYLETLKKTRLKMHVFCYQKQQKHSLREVGGFIRVLRFPPPRKLAATIKLK